MANKQDKELQRRKSDDAIMNRVLIDFGIVAVMLILLGVVNRNYSTAGGFEVWRAAFPWVSIAGAAIATIGLVLLFVKKLPRLSAWLLCVGAVFAVLGLLFFRYWVEPIPWLYFFTIAGGALYLVWLLYPHDFFLIAFLTTGCGGVFYLHSRGDFGLTTLTLYCVMIVLLVLSFLVTCRAAQAKGVFRFKKLRFRLFASKGTPIPLYLCCVVWAACSIAALLLKNSTFALYCVYAAAGALFVAACYYTIKLD